MEQLPPNFDAFLKDFHKECDTLPLHKQNEWLSHFIHAFISKDIALPTHSNEAEQAHMLTYIQTYLNVFLPNIHKPIFFDNTYTPFQWAAKTGYHYAIENHFGKIDANEPDMYGMRPLHLACLYGHANTVQALTQKGASFLLTNKQNQTPFFPLFTNTNQTTSTDIEHKYHIAEAFLHRFLLGSLEQDTDGNTIAHKMAVSGYDKALHYLVEQKIPLIYDVNYHGKAPIHVAVLNYQPNCIHVLLNAPDMPTCADDEGKNALHYVAQYGDEALLSLVKPYYASFDMLDNEGNTPAELAKRYNLSIAHLF